MNTFLWYIENIVRQSIQMIPCMAFSLILWGFIRPVRLRKLTEKGWRSPKRREAALLFYVLFCSGLCALTLFPYGFWEEYLKALQNPGYRPDVSFPSLEDSLTALRELPESITPFREILRVNRGGPWLWFVLWGNIGMFAPVGFGLPMLWRGKKWYHAVLLGFAFSFGIEVIQVFAGRVSDIDDLILNTAGTFIGYVLYHISSKVIPVYWDWFHCQKKEES